MATVSCLSNKDHENEIKLASSPTFQRNMWKQIKFHSTASTVNGFTSSVHGRHVIVINAVVVIKIQTFIKIALG